MAKYTIEDMHKLAAEKGGKCLSKKYRNPKTRLQWECAKGHVWERALGEIQRRNVWCSECEKIVRRNAKNKIMFAEMQSLAQIKGGRCLSTKYIDASTKLTWECAKGHIWNAAPAGIKNGGHWCPKCAGVEKLTIEDMHKIAVERGGKCLSKEYRNGHTKLKWECARGHVWEAKPNAVKNRGDWCPECAGKRKTIKDMRKLAAKRGGKCLSTIYISMNTKLKWECAKGHVFEAAPAHVKGTKNKKGSWCSECSGTKKLTIEDMHTFAAEKGGKCLSTEYINARTKLKWECAKGHVFESLPKRSWCAECAGTKKLTIEDMQKLAAERGGKCLSTKYINSRSKLKWECADGHVWETNQEAIQQGNWCIYCHFFLSEELCRTTFEQLFGSKFKKIRPDWLISPKGHRMELDGYCANLNIAFEYNGEQHYREISFGKGMNAEATLKKQKTHDLLKSKLCKENGVALFVVKHSADLASLPATIKSRAAKLRLDVEAINFDKEIDFNQVYLHKSKIKELQKIAEERGGKCLSKKYLGNKGRLKWQCAKGHIWLATASGIKNGGHWCPECLGSKKGSIKAMDKLAAERGGKCLSREYVNAHTKLKWECSKKHVWFANPNMVKGAKNTKGTWCPECAGRRKLSIDEMHRIAEERGGKCLSSEYRNGRTKLKWECAKGHVWEAAPADVKGNKNKKGSWCGICARNAHNSGSIGDKV